MFKSKKQQPEKSGLYNGGEMRTISTVEDGEYVTFFNYDKFAKVQTDRDKGLKYYSEISIYEKIKATIGNSYSGFLKSCLLFKTIFLYYFLIIINLLHINCFIV